MTHDMAIQILRRYDTNFGWEDGESIPAEAVVEAVEMAIEALKAQEPQEVIRSHDYIEGIVTRCPKCKDKIHKYNGSYCPRCGRAVKWS